MGVEVLWGILFCDGGGYGEEWEEVVWKSEYKKVMLIWEVVGGRVWEKGIESVDDIEMLEGNRRAELNYKVDENMERGSGWGRYMQLSI